MNALLQKTGASNASLCFKSSVHGEFIVMNERCAAKGPLLHVVQSNFGKTFGIYSSQPPIYNVESQYVFDKDVFLFSVLNSTNVDIMPGTYYGSTTLLQGRRTLSVGSASFSIAYPLTSQSSQVSITSGFTTTYSLPFMTTFDSSIDGALSSIHIYGTNQYVT